MGFSFDFTGERNVIVYHAGGWVWYWMKIYTDC